MFGVTVTYSIRLGQQAAFMRLLEAHIRSATTEDTGCLRADAFGDAARPGKVTLVEIFETSADFDAYRASPLAREFDTAVVDIVTARSIATWGDVVEARRAP